MEWWGGNNVLSAYVLTCDVHTRATLIMGGGGAITSCRPLSVRATACLMLTYTTSTYFTSTYSTLSCLPSMLTYTTLTYFTSTYSMLSCLPSMLTYTTSTLFTTSKLNGTQTLDRTWDICKQSIPRSLSSRKGAVSGMLDIYVHVWWWRHHHEGKDLLTQLGKLCSAKNAEWKELRCRLEWKRVVARNTKFTAICNKFTPLQLFFWFST